jgi:1,4-alpha-glucan branching enzyme
MTEKVRKSSAPEKKAKKDLAEKAPAAADNGWSQVKVTKTATPAKKTRAPKKSEEPGKLTARFTLDAPAATEVFVAGSFNGWDPAATCLQRDEAGMWVCSLSLDPGEHEYRFIVDGVWCDDPANGSRCRNAFDTQNSILVL